MESSMPEIMEEELSALVKSGFYNSRGDAITDAFRTLLNVKPELKIAASVELFREGKVSLSKGAELAGMSTVEFKETLSKRGIVRETEGKSRKELEERYERIFE